MEKFSIVFVKTFSAVLSGCRSDAFPVLLSLAHVVIIIDLEMLVLVILVLPFPQSRGPCCVTQYSHVCDIKKHDREFMTHQHV